MVTKVIPLLTDPGAHGADPADAFDVIVLPALPDGINRGGWEGAPDRTPESLTCQRVHGEADTDVIERWTVLANDGDEPIAVGRLDSATWTAPRLSDYRMSHLVGGWNDEFRLRRTPVPVAETVFTSRRGLTSHQANPWLAIDDGTDGEDHGAVWSGSWPMTADPAAEYYDSARDVRISGTAAETGLQLDLPPGDYASTLIRLRRV